MINKIVFGSWVLLAFSLLMIVISLSPALASNGSPPQFQKTWVCDGSNLCNYNTAEKVWECSDHMSCGMDLCSYPTQLMANGCWSPYCYKEARYTFEAPQEGAYKCEITVTTSYFDHGDTPQPYEYSDVSINGINLGKTEDPYCNGEDDGNGDDDSECFGNFARCDDPYDTECIFHYYTWYGSWTGSRCDDATACNFPTYGGGHTCANAGLCTGTGGGAWPNDFFTPFGNPAQCTGIYNNCCSAWLHGTWCGDCDGTDGNAVWKAKIKPKFCGDNNYGENYCETKVAAGPVSEGSPRCYWDNSHQVLKDLGGRGMPEGDTAGVPCSAAAPKDVGDRYKSLLGVYHHGNDAYFKGMGADGYDTNYICCFAKDGTVGEGMRCVRDDECESPMQCVDSVSGKLCKDGTPFVRKCTCGGAVANQAPNTPTLVTAPTSCNVNEDCVFRVKADDPDGDRVRYYFDWGDGNSEWVPADPNSVDSGTERQKAHEYVTAGTYTFKVRAQERVSPGVFGQYSSYAEHTFDVTDGGVTCPNPNGVCSPALGENPENCPDDCEYYNICEDIYFCDPYGAYGTIGVVEDQCQDDFDCGGCFPAGTKIHMADGSLKDIEDIEPGDKVLSFNGGWLTEGKVAYVHLPVKDKLYLLTTKSNELLVTGEHPLYVGKGEFLRVKELEIGDNVYVLNVDGISEEMITNKELLNDYVYVYNFEVGGGTYFAGGFAVHNKEPLPT